MDPYIREIVQKIQSGEIAYEAAYEELGPDIDEGFAESDQPTDSAPAGLSV